MALAHSRRFPFTRSARRRSALGLPDDATLVCAKVDARLLGLKLLSIEAQVVAGQPGKASASHELDPNFGRLDQFPLASKGSSDDLPFSAVSPELGRAVELFTSNAEVLKGLDPL